MNKQAMHNLQTIQEIKTALDLGYISYEQARLQAQPIIKNINQKAKDLAKKYKTKPQLVDFYSIMR